MFQVYQSAEATQLKGNTRESSQNEESENYSLSRLEKIESFNRQMAAFVKMCVLHKKVREIHLWISIGIY